MGNYVKVAKASDIKDREAIAVEIADKTLAVVNLDGAFYAIDNACSHEDGPLCEGFIEGDEIECPWHAARFNIKTGAATCPPAYEDVASYPTRVSGDDVEVLIDVPESD